MWEYVGIKIPRDPTVEKLKLKSKAVKTQQSYDGDWLKFVQYSKTRFNADPLEVDGIQDAYNLTEGYLNWLHTNIDAIKVKGKSEKLKWTTTVKKLKIKNKIQNCKTKIDKRKMKK